MRKWRVGTVSMGVLLVAAGILLLLGELQGLDGAGLILRWWPVILIILGVEILAYIIMSREEQPRIKFDGLSIFLTITIVLISSAVYGFHSFLQSDFSDRFFSEIGFYKYESVYNDSWEVEAAKVKSLQINNSHGDIKVESYQGGTIKIDAVILIRNNDKDQAEEIARDLVEVTEGENLLIDTRNEGLLLTRQDAAVNYYVKVPKEISFRINNEFGNTTMVDLEGDITAEARFGRVELKNIKGNVLIDNQSGETLARNIAGKAEINSEHGSITFLSKEPVLEDIIINCRMGNVELELPAGQQGSFQALTSHGKISFEGFQADIPVEGEMDKQELKGEIGAASPGIDVRTEHGSIFIKGR